MLNTELPQLHHTFETSLQRESIYIQKAKKCCLQYLVFRMALLLSALLQHQKQGRASLYLKNHCRVNPGCSEIPHPGKGITLAWKWLKDKDNLPLQAPRRREGGTAGKCWEDLHSSSLRHSEEMAISQQRLLQPAVQPRKVEVDRLKPGMCTWCLP